MPSHPEGLAIALTRIAEEKEKQTGFLDLGMLGLEEWPEELWELGHLTGLNLGSGWWDEGGDWNRTSLDIGPNLLVQTSAKWASLPRLAILSLCSLDWDNLLFVKDLRFLSVFDCSENGVNSLEPLSGLTSLQSLYCSSTPVSSLEPLSGLASLQSLNCRTTPVSSLEPLSGLTSLQSLDCSNTPVSNLEPLSGLASLQLLYCSNTPVSSLEPLSGLTSLQLLYCSNTPVSSLEPLSGLASLQSLNCRTTPVSSLEPLSGLASLQSLYCSDTQVSNFPQTLLWSNTLHNLVARDIPAGNIPQEVLSPNNHTSCLESLRAHFSDLSEGEALLPDIKVMVLGNGRIGKTQICNRLRGREYEPLADSTHGITVTTTELGESRLHLWDFGGQELYHGTHALFLKSRALFLAVWTPGSENSETHEHGGMTFRNHPLGYWLVYARNLSGPDSPLLVVQNQCDRKEDEQTRPPVPDGELKKFRFKSTLHYSAKENRRRAALDEEIQLAIDWLREKQGQAKIGRGRMAVKERLEAMKNADAEIPDVSRRQHRTLAMADYLAICEECGGVSSPGHLLEYLHHSGIVFYQKRLFDDRIIMDQAWALDAVYAVFNRKKCYLQLKQTGGRFTRTLLEALVWQEYQKEEQELFLDMMQSCGVCFLHRKEDLKRGIEAEYIAPDLLPGYEEMEGEVEAWWDDSIPADEVEVTLKFMHPGVIRNLLSRIGRHAGMEAVYWKDGVCLYERTTRSHGRIEHRPLTGEEWGGGIRIQTQRGASMELLEVLKRWAMEEAREEKCGGVMAEIKEHPVHIVARDGHPDKEKETETPPKMEFTEPPRDKPTYAVSYAWEKHSEAMVDQLCAQAVDLHGVTILRDKTHVGLGDRISRFMRTLTDQDRVFVILSAKYLQSAFCMDELFRIWQASRMDDGEFLKRIRIYRMPDAAMMSPMERARCAKYWRDQFKELDEFVKAEGPDLLGEADFNRYRLMQGFALQVGNILAAIADTLLPHDFAELEKYGFGDGKP